MIRQLPPRFRSLYRLVLRTSSASVLHIRPAAPRLRAMWRPTFGVAAQMTRKTQNTEDEAGAAHAREWLNKWEERMDSTLSLLYHSATSRGLAHQLTRNLHSLSYHRKVWLHSAYERSNTPWKPTGEFIQPKPNKRRTDQNELGELGWNMVGEVVRMAEGRDRLMLGRVPLRQHQTYRNVE